MYFSDNILLLLLFAVCAILADSGEQEDADDGESAG